MIMASYDLYIDGQCSLKDIFPALEKSAEPKEFYSNLLTLKNENPEKQTVLHWAAIAGRLDDLESIISMLKDRRSMVLAAQDKNGNTALYYAADSGHSEVVKYLLTTAQEPEEKYNLLMVKGRKFKATVLHSAAERDKHELIKYILGLDDLTAYNIYNLLTTSDSDGYTPVHSAAKNGHTRSLRVMLDSLPAILLGMKTKTSQTPLELSNESCHLETCRVIQDYISTDTTEPQKSPNSDLQTKARSITKVRELCIRKRFSESIQSVEGM